MAPRHSRGGRVRINENQELLLQIATFVVEGSCFTLMCDLVEQPGVPVAMCLLFVLNNTQNISSHRLDLMLEFSQ